MIEERVVAVDDDWIIFDPGLIVEPTPASFDPAAWGRAVVGSAEGRSSAWFIEHEEQAWVLRHYWRGGLPGKLFKDKYFYPGRQRARPFREWRVLAQAHADGVNVPRPVAARLHRHSLYNYSGDILMQRIVGAHSLADKLADGSMTPALWDAMAMAIARCHQAGYWHADLNARNLLCRDGQWWLIDFDRARKRTAGTWGYENIRRLKRSLDKLSAAGELRYSRQQWRDFVEAWHVGLCGPG